MVVCDTLSGLCGEKTLEDKFFDVFAEYTEAKGGEAR